MHLEEEPKTRQSKLCGFWKGWQAVLNCTRLYWAALAGTTLNCTALVRAISQDDMRSENIWFSWSKPSKYWEKLRGHSCDGRRTDGKWKLVQYSVWPETAITHSVKMDQGGLFTSLVISSSCVALLLRHWCEIMALHYVKSNLTEISASWQDRRVL